MLFKKSRYEKKQKKKRWVDEHRKLFMAADAHAG